MYNGPVVATITDLSERCGAPELRSRAQAGSAWEFDPVESSATSELANPQLMAS